MIVGEQSALVVLTPEAEPLVKDFRSSYDPAAADGMPAHITVHFPFIPPQHLGVDVLDMLQVICLRQAPFDIQLSETRRWPGVLYLAPSPEEPLIELTLAVARRYPSFLPYEGEFDDVLPHLTVAQPKDAGQLDEIATQFLQASDGRLPIDVSVREVWLMVKHNGIWTPKVPFALGHPGTVEADAG
jgi:2'-5' RNA ligase